MQPSQQHSCGHADRYADRQAADEMEQPEHDPIAGARFARRFVVVVPLGMAVAGQAVVREPDDENH